jgi:hypothetical protein
VNSFISNFLRVVMKTKNTIRFIMLRLVRLLNFRRFIAVAVFVAAFGVVNAASLEEGFKDPPREAGVRCWWWWLNSNVTKEAITRDLQAMHDKGFSGAMIFDAGNNKRLKKGIVPNGPQFGGEKWAELYLHALQEAKRVDLKIGLSIQSGWNLGGPGVTLDDAAKQLTTSEITVKDGEEINQKLPQPKTNYAYYRDICVLAYPRKKFTGKNRKPISKIVSKTGAKELGGSAPDCRYLLNDIPAVAGEEDAAMEDIIDLTDKISGDGTLKWKAPEGEWVILRIGYTPTKAHVSTSSDNWQGHVVDYLSKDAFNRYWNRVVEPLLKKAGPMAGTVLTQLETDSWECGGMNWSPEFAEEFKKYNGYDLIKYLPVTAGKIIESRQASNAFLADFRKTIAHCISENHYRTFAENAARYNIGIQPECSGPHAGPLDGIKNYSHSDIVMSEFWAPSPHRPTPSKRFFVKQASSAAHIYGKKYVGAESFTTIGPHWNDLLWHAQKPSMDYEFTEGLNMIFFHTFTCSPKEMGLPGQEYFAGTHVNPNVTWWDESGPFMDYINRVQYITQQGKFVADVLYYYGDHVPNIAVNKGFNLAGCMPGYDHDVTNEDILLRLTVDDGRVVVPGGVRYRVLVLPDHKVLSLAVLKKVESLLKQGATVLGAKPERLVSRIGGDDAQRQFHELAARLWGDSPKRTGQKKVGKGRLVWGQTSRDFLIDDGIVPDFESLNTKRQADYEYIHYTIDGADVYFVCNQSTESRVVDLAFRVSGRQPELWDPASGEIRIAEDFTPKGQQTIVPMSFDPHGSMFVIFRSEANAAANAGSNFPVWKEKGQVSGPWKVSFDPKWGGPAEPVVFDKLTSWTKHSNPGIKYYSGKATYSTLFTLDKFSSDESLALELGSIKDVGIARVTLNGKDLGVLWLAPFRVDISNAAKSGENQLEIMVVNSWHNRVMGDEMLPQNQRYTKTNIQVLNKGPFKWQLEDSGLLGPVRILQAEKTEIVKAGSINITDFNVMDKRNK